MGCCRCQHRWACPCARSWSDQRQPRGCLAWRARGWGCGRTTWAPGLCWAAGRFLSAACLRRGTGQDQQQTSHPPPTPAPTPESHNACKTTLAWCTATATPAHSHPRRTMDKHKQRQNTANRKPRGGTPNPTPPPLPSPSRTPTPAPAPAPTPTPSTTRADKTPTRTKRRAHGGGAGGGGRLHRNSRLQHGFPGAGRPQLRLQRLHLHTQRRAGCGRSKTPCARWGLQPCIRPRGRERQERGPWGGGHMRPMRPTHPPFPCPRIPSRGTTGRQHHRASARGGIGMLDSRANTSLHTPDAEGRRCAAHFRPAPFQAACAWTPTPPSAAQRPQTCG